MIRQTLAVVLPLLQCARAFIANQEACQADRGGEIATGRATWCASGCTDAPDCVGGVCVAGATLAMAQADWQSIMTTTAAKGATPPVVVYVNPPSAETSGFGCWNGVKHGMQATGGWLREQSAASSVHRFLDMDEVFRRTCNTTERACRITDGIHPTVYGQTLMAQAFYDCLAQVGGAADGDCDGGTCIAGRTSMACTTDADCDLHRCNLVSP